MSSFKSTKGTHRLDKGTKGTHRLDGGEVEVALARLLDRMSRTARGVRGVHESTEEDLACEITRTLDANRKRVREKHHVDETGTPSRSGSIRYYREIGIRPD